MKPAAMIVCVYLLALLPSARAYSGQADSSDRAPPTPLEVKQSQNHQTLPPYEIFEITFQHDGRTIIRSSMS